MDTIYDDIFLGLTENFLEKLNTTTEHRQCYIALNYINGAQFEKAKEEIAKLTAENHNCSIVLECKSLLAYYSRNNKKAYAYGQEAVRNNQKSVFAYAVLAKIDLLKKPSKAIKYYAEILEIYPKHDRTLLNMADALYQKRETRHLSQVYVNRATPSKRRFWYKLLLLSSSKGNQFLWLLIAFIMFIIPTMGKFIFVITIAFVLLGIVTSIRNDYYLISSRLLNILLRLFLIWALVLLIKSLFQTAY